MLTPVVTEKLARRPLEPARPRDPLQKALRAAQSAMYVPYRRREPAAGLESSAPNLATALARPRSRVGST